LLCVAHSNTPNPHRLVSRTDILVCDATPRQCINATVFPRDFDGNRGGGRGISVG
jgi:hypothetical protein